MSPRLLTALPLGTTKAQEGLLQGRVHQNLWLEMVVMATAASALMALVAGAVVMRHEQMHLGHEVEDMQRQLGIGLTSYEPLHRLQRHLQQASSGQEVELALVVNNRGRVLAASNNALVGLSLIEVLQQPDQGNLRALFAPCAAGGWSAASLAPCLRKESRLFVGPLPWLGGDVVLSRQPYPLALEGMGGYGEQATLITGTDAQPAGREALKLTLTVFLTSLLPLLVGCAGLMLRLRTRLIPELLRLAQMDALSGVFNRRAFLETAESLLRQGERAAVPMSLAVIDVDHFKQINDSYGHESGDRVIQRVSELLRSSVRGADLVGRLGGDEFVILLQLPGPAASQALDRILDTIRNTAIRVDAERSVRVTLSVGVACSEDKEGHQLGELMGAADAALYVAKDRGRDQVVNLQLEVQRPQPAKRRLGEWQIHGA